MPERLLKYYRPYRKTLFFALLGSVITSALDLCFPLFMRYILGDVLPEGNLFLLGQATIILLFLYLLNFIISYQVSRHGRLMGAKIEQDMRSDLFQHVQSMSFRYFDNIRIGQLISRIVSDIAEIRELVFLGPNYLLVCTITMLGTLGILIYLNWPLALLVNLLLLGKAYESVATNHALKQSGRMIREQVGNLIAQTNESLNAIRLVKSFNNEEWEEKRLDKNGQALLQARKTSFDLLSRLNSNAVLFSNVTNLVIIVVGGAMIAYGKMQISDLVAFLLYVSIFIRPILRLTALAESYQKGMAGYQRFCQLMDTPSENTDLPGAVDCGTLKGSISFKNVSFGYDPGKPVIQNFDLDIAAGEVIAFVGTTGVGKSTICNLLPRFYELQQGVITIDGMDIRNVTLKSLRRNIGIVQQDIFLFSDSVRENIAYGNPHASMEEIITAARLAEADAFINQLPDGYDSQLGERGVKLSGGQKQRIAIARVFLKNPPILILDEATSSLDNETENLIQESLMQLSRNRTTLIVAHRLATIRHADRIVVLTPNGISEHGSHDDLMALQGEYYKLYMAQFSKSPLN